MIWSFQLFMMGLPLFQIPCLIVTLEAFIRVQGPLMATLSIAVCALGRTPEYALSLGQVCWGTGCNVSADIWKAGKPVLGLLDLLGINHSA